MGKTNLTFRDRVRQARENEWSAYRRALRREHQERFDHLWMRPQSIRWRVAR